MLPAEERAEETLPEEQPLSEELSEFVLLAKLARADNILTLDFIPNEALLSLRFSLHYKVNCDIIYS